jgi:hypothetical protein
MDWKAVDMVLEGKTVLQKRVKHTGAKNKLQKLVSYGLPIDNLEHFMDIRPIPASLSRCRFL